MNEDRMHELLSYKNVLQIISKMITSKLLNAFKCLKRPGLRFYESVGPSILPSSFKSSSSINIYKAEEYDGIISPYHRFKRKTCFFEKLG